MDTTPSKTLCEVFTKPAIKVTTATSYSICRDAHEFARAIVGEYGTKAEYTAMVRLWPRFLGVVGIEITTWPVK